MVANAIGMPWAVYLAVVALLSIAERLVFALTGSELDVVNRLVDTLLMATAGGGMIAVPVWCCYRARGLSRYESNFMRLFMFSILVPVMAVLLITLIVNDLDGGLLLFILPVTSPVTTFVGVLFLMFWERR